MNYIDLIKKSVRKYEGQKYFNMDIPGISRLFPIVNVGKNIWIASNAEVVLGDIEFADKVSDLLAGKIKENNGIDNILTAEAKAIGLSYFLAYKLGLDKIIIARKSVKSYMVNPIIVKTRSITTSHEQILVLNSIDANRIRDKKIIVFDDVISTGNTIKSLINLAEKAGAKIVGIVTVWLEGPWPWEIFEDYIKNRKLIFISYLPIFAFGEEYFSLRQKINSLLGRYHD